MQWARSLGKVQEVGQSKVQGWSSPNWKGSCGPIFIWIWGGQEASTLAHGKGIEGARPSGVLPKAKAFGGSPDWGECVYSPGTGEELVKDSCSALPTHGGF